MINLSIDPQTWVTIFELFCFMAFAFCLGCVCETILYDWKHPENVPEEHRRKPPQWYTLNRFDTTDEEGISQ